MPRIRFGTFLAPHHPFGENPTLLFQRDLEFAAHLDRLGFDEFWCGEHHSSGWEMIASPEMFLAAAAQRTHRIMLGTGVISLPYHHPFNVAQRIVQLDHMSNGRAMFGSGPGALPSDARTLGIDPMVQRDRQDEALSVIIPLLRGEERFSYKSEWFELNEARAPDPAGAGGHADGRRVVDLAVGHEARRQVRHGRAVDRLELHRGHLRRCRRSGASPRRPPTKHGQTVDRKNWRVMMAFHLAESKEQARNEAVDGLQRWHNEYNVYTLGRPNATAVDDKWELLDQTTGGGAVGAGAAVDRHARRARRRDPPPAGGHRRLRRRARLRPRLGEPRGDAAVVGPDGPLRHPRDQRLDRPGSANRRSTCTPTRPS